MSSLSDFLALSDIPKTAPFRREDIPVEVVTCDENERLSRRVFDNLKAAQAAFPGLDLFHGSPGFTWAMRGEVDGKIAARFESTAAYKSLSQ